MFGRLMPKEGRFFDMFNEHAALCVKGAQELQAIMSDFKDFESRKRIIDAIEKEADQVTQKTVVMVHKTFITPIDRDDIHRLITRMDDILDLIEDVVQTISLYDIQETTPEAQRFAELILACTLKVQEAVVLMSNMKNADKIMEVCHEIDRLETDADHVMHAALSRLFREEPDVRNLIKLKTLYEYMELTTDRCEEVADIIEGIVVENA